MAIAALLLVFGLFAGLAVLLGGLALLAGYMYLTREGRPEVIQSLRFDREGLTWREVRVPWNLVRGVRLVQQPVAGTWRRIPLLSLELHDVLPLLDDDASWRARLGRELQHDLNADEIVIPLDFFKAPAEEIVEATRLAWLGELTLPEVDSSGEKRVPARVRRMHPLLRAAPGLALVALGCAQWAFADSIDGMAADRRDQLELIGMLMLPAGLAAAFPGILAWLRGDDLRE
jgi:hypothetical protein